MRIIVGSEWLEEKNPFGGVRRYRWVGNVKEYEMTIRIDGYEVPESELEEFNRRRREDNERRKKEQVKASKVQLRSCPFRDGLNTMCTEERCAMYTADKGCALAQIGSKTPTMNRLGAACPFSRYNSPCRETCAMFNGGCLFTAR